MSLEVDVDVDVEVEQGLDALVELARAGGLVVLTGAGCSTESGIPDYRGPETRRRARNPVQHRAFLQKPEARTRYWSRSFVGWPKFNLAKPNPAHTALTSLERLGVVTGIITQNVDRLHHAAGSSQVTELHGALAEVRCLECHLIEGRNAFQERLAELNPAFLGEISSLAPDGDADLLKEVPFAVATCVRCEGVMMPNVVFFGGSVPKPVVAEAFERLEQATALLVVGSSLAVFSGFRFVRKAHQVGTPIALVNLGETRGHAYADVIIEGRAGHVLPKLLSRLT